MMTARRILFTFLFFTINLSSATNLFATTPQQNLPSARQCLTSLCMLACSTQAITDLGCSQRSSNSSLCTGIFTDGKNTFTPEIVEMRCHDSVCNAVVTGMACDVGVCGVVPNVTQSRRLRGLQEVNVTENPVQATADGRYILPCNQTGIASGNVTIGNTTSLVQTAICTNYVNPSSASIMGCGYNYNSYCDWTGCYCNYYCNTCYYGAYSWRCFSGNTEVLTPHGRVRLENLEVGEFVAYGVDKDNNVLYTKVLRIPHRNAQAQTPYIGIQVKGSDEFYFASESHYLWRIDIEVRKDKHGKGFHMVHPVHARTIKVDDILISNTNRDVGLGSFKFNIRHHKTNRVEQVKKSVEEGKFAPQTQNGNLLIFRGNTTLLVNSYGGEFSPQFYHAAFNYALPALHAVYPGIYDPQTTAPPRSNKEW